MKRTFYLINEETKDGPAFLPIEVSILRRLHDRHQELGSKDKIIDYLKKLLKMVGFSTDEALYYYYLFSANFRPDKRYDLITKSNISSLINLKSEKTANYKMREFIKSKLPFRGNNVEGIWEKDYNGVNQYVVTSYTWYPILIFKENSWYKTMDSYSSTTAKQISQSDMGERTLKKRALKVLPQTEMINLRKGKNLESVEEDALNRIKSQLEEELKEKTFRFNFDLPNLGLIGKGSYEVNDISFDKNEIKFSVGVKSGSLYGEQGVISDVFGKDSEFKTQLEIEINKIIKLKLYKFRRGTEKIVGRNITIDFDYSKI